MACEVIWKVALYIIGTLFLAVFTKVIDAMADKWGIFLGVWIAVIVVFLELIVT